MSFKSRSLFVAMASLSAISYGHAAGLDRSTQPSWGFTQDGTFAYIEHVTIDPKVEGKDLPTNNKVPDMAEDYQFLNFGAKADINDRVSVGAFFDQPWGADAQYTGDNNFVASTTGDAKISGIAQAIATQLAANPSTAALAPAVRSITTVARAEQLAGSGLVPVALRPTLDNAIAAAKSADAQLGEGTNVTVSSQNFTGLVGVKLGENKNFQIYGGPALQKLEGEVHLRGTAYRGASGYDLNLPNSTAVGWMAGVAYSKPEIALKAALTYRSEIDHDFDSTETFPLAPLVQGANLPATQSNTFTVTTPQSVNVDFQTGLNKTTLLTAKVRWVPWSDFAVTPKLYNAAGRINLVDYKKDGWTAEVGLGKKLSDQLAISGSVGWDSGAGNPTTTLGPVDGNWNVGLGAKYNITPEWAISGGVKYLMFGDATAQLPDHATNVGEFSDNDGLVYGVRLSYQKK